ncbi:transcription termination factor MTERF4, chloroplastic [Olea europaea subsp. europaea]|uniref:Transcription termination factor MTERF4, chloroplastic n=1 Tax=Olea europaea subsp. europaea TaxID=158383 RepID=A0A8S0UTK3_OLEEU|nr:transcription termination factor MTERF4, chloroplastic [Olea europaea subsp. europaea]
MPSVTWGVIQGRKEKLVSGVIICDYLKTIDILTDELEELELPSTIEVMRERVEFLQKLGLTIDDINEFPLTLGYSVRKNMIPVLGYLEKIGIPRTTMGEFLKNYPQCLHATVVVELVPVVKFLRGLNIEKQDIGEIASRVPRVLYLQLKPRYRRLQSGGIRCSLAWFLNCSDMRFEERLKGEYIEAESGGSTFIMGGKLELPGSEIISGV